MTTNKLVLERLNDWSTEISQWTPAASIYVEEVKWELIRAFEKTDWSHEVHLWEWMSTALNVSSQGIKMYQISILNYLNKVLESENNIAA